MGQVVKSRLNASCEVVLPENDCKRCFETRKRLTFRIKGGMVQYMRVVRTGSKWCSEWNNFNGAHTTFQGGIDSQGLPRNALEKGRYKHDVGKRLSIKGWRADKKG